VIQEDGRWWRIPPTVTPSPPAGAFPIFENGEEKQGVLWEKLQSLITFLGANVDSIKAAYWINNPLLADQFEAFLACTTSKRQLNPFLFDSQGWKSSASDLELKEAYMEKLTASLARATRLMGREGVTPVIQGTREDAAHRIAKNGFGILATRDPGWYGQGIYFTTKFAYAVKYSSFAKERGNAFVIGVAIPGNPYPVTTNKDHPTQSFLARSCQRGYQSHYTVIDPNEDCYPLLSRPNEDSLDELVMFEPAQVLPLAIVYADLDRLQTTPAPIFPPKPPVSADPGSPQMLPGPAASSKPADKVRSEWFH